MPGFLVLPIGADLSSSVQDLGSMVFASELAIVRLRPILTRLRVDTTARVRPLMVLFSLFDALS